MTATLEAPALTTATPPTAAPVPKRWLGLFAILLNLLDASIVNVALPVIQGDLGGSYATLQWIAASYTLVLAVGLLTGGRLGDMFGRKRMLLIGATGFVAASLMCAFAMSPETLIAARALQAMFGAVMIPQCFGLIRDLFPGEDQAMAWGGRQLHAPARPDRARPCRHVPPDGLPVILGLGKRMFGETSDTADLRLVEAKPVGTDGILILTYEAGR